MCHHLGVHTCHSPAGADCRRLPRRAEHDRDTRRRLRAGCAGRRTASARGAAERQCPPALHAVRTGPPEPSDRFRRAATFADAALRSVLEVIDRRRPVTQLRPMLSTGLIDSVVSFARAAPARQSGAVLRRVRLQASGPDERAFEVSASYTPGAATARRGLPCRTGRHTAGRRLAGRRLAYGLSACTWAEPCTWVQVLRAGPSSCGSWPPAGPPHAVPVGWVHPPSRPPRAAGRRRCAAPARNRPRTGRCR